MVLDSLGRAIDNTIRKLRRLPRVDKESIKAVIQDLQRALLSADVNVELTLQITDNIKKKAFDEKISSGVARKDYVIKLIHDELVNLLGGDKPVRKIKAGRLNIILMVGIQGSGKTTTVGKLANFYKNRGFRVGVVCSDTWRPGAYEQLKQLLEPISVELYGAPEEKNALKIAKKGIKYFTNLKERPDIIIVDTAGRHKQEKELMEEVKKLEQIIKPNEVILVIDGTLGQQAYNQAKAFAEATHVGSIIVTKLDGSAKGGGALSAAAATKAPIKFIGVGEKIDDLEEFNATKFVGTLMGIPDIEGLLEKIKDANIEADKDMAKRLMKGKFTLDDLYKQLIALRKMGPISKIIKMLGGQNLPSEMKEMAEQNLDNWKVVLSSMTQYEKENPHVIKRSRIERIAHGSGKSYSDIKALLKQYEQMKNLISKLTKPRRGKKGQMPGMGGMGMPGMPDIGSLLGKK
ncbi:MAG: signal recognition particle receptor subunit alpha [Promethearchaeota archaeon]